MGRGHKIDRAELQVPDQIVEIIRRDTWVGGIAGIGPIISPP